MCVLIILPKNCYIVIESNVILMSMPNVNVILDSNCHFEKLNTRKFVIFGSQNVKHVYGISFQFP